jgi:lipid-binding SYLF domain-containing protein
MKMSVALMMVGAVLPLVAAKESEPTARLRESAAVFSEIMATPDKGIPKELLENAHCIVIVPGLKKGAFIVGGEFGKGFISCRGPKSMGWSAPAAIRMEGGSFGFQIGGSETDVVMLVMNARGADKLLSSEFTLGGEADIAAGPVGRSATAQTDAMMRAEILSWSRSRGVFAGIALKGATLREDLDNNEKMYGKRLENREVVSSGIAPSASARRLMTLLNVYSFRERGKTE